MSQRARRTVAILLLALLGLGWIAAPAAAETEVAFEITDVRITESSSLTRDTGEGRYWTANDSGDAARVFAVSETGEIEGTVNFRADVVDVEAIQYFEGALYIADIGDNEGTREVITVYILTDLVPDDRTVLYQAYDFVYSDGAHDAETLLIDPNGRLYLVTKDEDAGIYTAPEQPSRSTVNTLTRVADAPPYVTDGQYLDDGRVAVRSYVDVQILDPSGFATVARAGAPFQRQGESLTQNLDGDALLLGSEGESEVYAMPIPTSVDEAPTGGASPPASPQPSPTASPSAPAGASRSASAGASGDDPEVGTDVPDGSSSRSGTFLALILAAVVAAGAGYGVYWLRGRVDDYY